MAVREVLLCLQESEVAEEEAPSPCSGGVSPVALRILGSAGSGHLSVHRESCLLPLVLGYSGHRCPRVGTDGSWGEGFHS